MDKNYILQKLSQEKELFKVNMKQKKRKANPTIEKDEIISKLKELKSLYSKEGFIIKELFGSYSR